MRRLLIILGLLALIAAPAATAKPNKADKRQAQQQCRAERGTTDATRQAFKAKYRNFGACVTKKARRVEAARKKARANAARECREERGDTAASRDAFRTEYGTNANGKNAFGKCVSQKVREAAAKAQRRECAGRGVPASKISIQLWTFAEYIGFGTDAATIARTEEVLRRLSEMGYRNVEPFTLSGLTAEQYRALLDKYGLKASARHVNVGTPTSPVNFEQIIEENRTLGIKFFGSGGTPRYTTEAEWIAYAEYLDALGAQARQAGQRLMVHNHNWEFQTVFGDRTAFDILMEHTDPRNVVFQLDLYWATSGGADPVEVLERYGNRIELFHVKDMRAGDRRIEIVGEGIIDFPQIFAASQGPVRYYVVEHDPRFGDPTFDPFEAAQKGFTYLDCVTF